MMEYLIIPLVVFPTLAGIVIIYRLKYLKREEARINARLNVLDIIGHRIKHAQCEICGAECGYAEGTKAVRVTRDPYLKVLCPVCARTHNFYPIFVESEDRDEAVYGIEYVVWPPRDEYDGKYPPYLRRIK